MTFDLQWYGTCGSRGSYVKGGTPRHVNFKAVLTREKEREEGERGE